MKHINYENMTDFRKTVETGVDPRLGFELLVRNMKDYKTSATLMELITRPTIDNLEKIPSEIAGLLRLPVNAGYFFTTTRRFT